VKPIESNWWDNYNVFAADWVHCSASLQLGVQIKSFLHCANSGELSGVHAHRIIMQSFTFWWQHNSSTRSNRASTGRYSVSTALCSDNIITTNYVKISQWKPIQLSSKPVYIPWANFSAVSYNQKQMQTPCIRRFRFAIPMVRYSEILDSTYRNTSLNPNLFHYLYPNSNLNPIYMWKKFRLGYIEP
jgi:hypothetical protein